VRSRFVFKRITDFRVGKSVAGGQAFLQALGDRRARLRGVGALVPTMAGLRVRSSPPPGIGDDCHGAVVHLATRRTPGMFATWLRRAYELAAVHRAGHHRRIQHAGILRSIA